jgi:hypothetical protein
LVNTLAVKVLVLRVVLFGSIVLIWVVNSI